MTNNQLTGLGANHPANSPLTTERLGHVRDVLQRNLQYSNGGSMDYIITDAVKAIDELLEVRKAEPVADVVAWASPNEERTCDIRWRRHDVAPGPLYTAPPAPVVPDECPVEIRDLMASHSDALFHDGDAQEIWNACRAAMLNGGKS